MRTLDVFQEAPWKPYLKNVKAFEAEYSAGGAAFQREWEEKTPPGRVRIHLERAEPDNDKITFDVTPGIGAARW